jgi:capsule polysaccharide export protein KpsE/RkpR
MNNDSPLRAAFRLANEKRGLAQTAHNAAVERAEAAYRDAARRVLALRYANDPDDESTLAWAERCLYDAAVSLNDLMVNDHFDVIATALAYFDAQVQLDAEILREMEV